MPVGPGPDPQQRLIALEREFPLFLLASLLPVLLFPWARRSGSGLAVLITPVVMDLLVIQSLRTLPLIRPGRLARFGLALHRLLGLLTALTVWLPLLLGSRLNASALGLMAILMACFSLVTGVRLVRLLALVPRVNPRVLSGAAGGYVHLGFTGGIVATAIEYLNPGSFHLGTMPPGAELTDRLIYFSYVTMASLGYGDVLPANAIGERFAILLSLAGNLYLSLLLGLLLGRFIGGIEAERRPPSR